MVQSKYFSLKTYYLRITNNEIVQNSKSKPKNSHSCVPLRGSQRMGGRENSLQNLRITPFNKDLSNETTFSLTNLAGQVPLNLGFKVLIDFPIVL